MFTSEYRDRLRLELIAAARADERISGVAVTGSAAAEGQDAWSDIDLAFGVRDGADLSQTLGIPGEWEHPRLWSAIERVAAACRRAGRPWGILPMSPAHARRSVALGCTMLSIGPWSGSMSFNPL